MQPEEIYEAELVADETAQTMEPRSRKVHLIEQILSPQSLQWMMLSGGGVLTLGFVVWLWSVHVFEHPLVVCGLVGAATLSLLGAGVAMVRSTRYQLAGRGIALLGSIALPLNLWLYDAQGLVTLANGGHLWIPAALFCLIYAGVARVLRDSTFVYALVGGVVITGMLFLADQSVGRFWALMPPVTFLVVIGWLSAFADRLFVDDDGDFSRKNFGLAFHRAGLVVVTSGLTLLLGGHIAAAGTYLISGGLWPLIADSQALKLWALGIIGASAAGFGLLSALHKSSWYRVGTILLATWSVPALLDFFSIEITLSHIAIVVTLAIFVFNVLASWINDGGSVSVKTVQTVRNFSPPIVGIFAALAFSQLAAQALNLGDVVIFSSLSWISTIQILMTGLAACATGWNCQSVADGSKTENVLAHLLLGTGAALVVSAAWSAIFLLTMPLQIAAGLVVLIPIGLATLSVVMKSPRSISVFQNLAAVAMTAHLVLRAVVGANERFYHSAIFGETSLQLGTVFAIGSAVYWFVSRDQAKSFTRVLSYLAATFSVAAMVNYIGFELGYCIVLAPMLLGLGLRVIESLTEIKVQADDEESSKPDAEAKLTQISLTANALVLGSGIGGVLLALSRWVVSDVSGSLMLVMITLLACTTVVSLLTKNQAWRTGFRALIVALIGASLCVFDGWLAIDGWQRLELCSIFGGAVILALGHVAWSREDALQDDAASAALGLGSLFMAVPLAVGLVVYRVGGAIDPNWMMFHEVMAIAVGLILFGSGVCCKLRATTITGAGLLGVYLLSLLALIQWPSQLQSVSVMMMIGGGLFFATALLLSICRDRLVSLPRRIREGEGVYRILKWR